MAESTNPALDALSGTIGLANRYRTLSILLSIKLVATAVVATALFCS